MLQRTSLSAERIPMRRREFITLLGGVAVAAHMDEVVEQ
jgi:hypothetical protein